MTAPVSSSMAAVLARVSSLEVSFGLRKPATATTSPSATDFESVLQGALGTDGAAAAGLAPGSSSGGGAIVDTARRYLGIPYLWGGTDPEVGLDCSGFVLNVFDDLGVDLPRVSRDQADVGQPVASLDDARPGDLLFFNEPVSHVAIYLGDGDMIHAAGTGKDVRITDVYETPTHIRRVPVPGAVGLGAAWTGGATANGLGAAWGAGGVAGLGASGLGGGLGAAWGVGGVASSSATAAGAGGRGGLGPTRFDALFAAAGARYGVDPAVLSAVARTESGYDPSAVSGAGAQGLMQLMPSTAAGLGVSDPFDPAQAVDGAARLLRSHLDRFGSLPLALAAYNAGPGAVSRHGGIPPYQETQQYVQRVLSTLGAAA